MRTVRDARSTVSTPPRKGLSAKAVLWIGSAAAISIGAVVGLIFLASKTTPTDSTVLQNNTQPKVLTFEEMTAKTNMKDSAAVLQLGFWAQSRGLQHEFEECLAKVLELDPKHSRARAHLLQIYEQKIDEARLTNDKETFRAVMHWASKSGLSEQATKVADWIIKKHDAEDAEAREILGHVRMGGKWEDKAFAEDLLAMLRDKQLEWDKIQSMTPRQREMYILRQGLQKELGEDFFEYDLDPYYIAIQKGNFAGEIVLADYGQILKHLYDTFYREYGEKLGLLEMKDLVVPVVIFKNRDEYMKHGGPAVARGHYQVGAPETPSVQKRLVTYYDPTSEPYEVLFHEGIHQISYFAAHSRGKDLSRAFWFVEGLAGYFEAFTRDSKGQIVFFQPNSKYLAIVRKALKDGKSMPWKDYLKMGVPEVQSLPGPQLGLAYSLGWSIIYFFTNYENGKYREKWEQYFRAEVEGQASFDKLKEIFGDLEPIEDEWKKYVTGLMGTE